MRFLTDIRTKLEKRPRRRSSFSKSTPWVSTPWVFYVCSAPFAGIGVYVANDPIMAALVVLIALWCVDLGWGLGREGRVDELEAELFESRAAGKDTTE